MYEDFYEKLHELAIVPVVVLDKVEDAVPMARALVAGGMPSAEVTFRTACAAECIKAMHTTRSPRSASAPAPCSPSSRSTRPSPRALPSS